MTPNLGSYIRAKREERMLSLRALAGVLDIAPAFQSDIEHGRRYPSPEVLERMAKGLRVPLEELKKHDTRVRAELRDWLQEHSEVTGLLTEFQKSGRPTEALVAAWRKAVKSQKR